MCLRRELKKKVSIYLEAIKSLKNIISHLFMKDCCLKEYAARAWRKTSFSAYCQSLRTRVLAPAPMEGRQGMVAWVLKSQQCGYKDKRILGAHWSKHSEPSASFGIFCLDITNSTSLHMSLAKAGHMALPGCCINEKWITFPWKGW